MSLGLRQRETEEINRDEDLRKRKPGACRFLRFKSIEQLNVRKE